VLVAVDLGSKAWAWRYASDGEVQVFGKVLTIVRVYNPGGVFGLGQDLTLPLTLVRLLAVVVLLVLVRRQPRDNSRGVLTLALLLAGAVGNLYDNLSSWSWIPWSGNGMVRDFLKVDLGFWPFAPWPVFNFADSCITVGFLLLITGLAVIRMRSEVPEGDP